MVAPPLMPAPTPAPATSPPAATVPTTAGNPPPAATGAPAGNVVAAAAPSALPQVMVLPVEDIAALNLIADLQRYNAFGADEVRRELAAATNALARERSDANRVRLAVLYTLSHASQDDQRALQLLESVTKANPGSPAVKQLAAVLYAQVAERARAVRDEQQKVDAALKKLDALRSMERDLLRDRVRGGGGGAGGGGSSGKVQVAA